MYLEYFGLRERPFLLTPDAEFLYLSEQHAQAKAHMEYAVLNHDSCVVVSGDIGCGKTTLINRFLADIDPRVVVARVFQTQVTPVQFLRGVLAQFGKPDFKAKKAELLDTVYHFLLEQERHRRQVVLVVDEAQNLSLSVLEEIRLLTDIETQKAKILNVILCGQPELRQKINDPRMAQLAQRIRFRVHLWPLNEDETCRYILHRLHVAGSDDERAVFDAGIFGIIHEYTGGVPRLINTLCDTAMTAAYVEDQPAVTESLLMTAIDELGWIPRGSISVDHNDETGPLPLPEPAAKLLLSRDARLIGEFWLQEGRLVIGRDADNDIAIASEYISRHHAQVNYFDGRYWIQDLNSTNGTLVNGKRVRKQVLNDNDEIGVGRHKLLFREAPGIAPAVDSKTESLADWRSTTVLASDAKPRKQAT